MSVPQGHKTRYAIVGTGARAEMFVRALVVDHAERAQLVALADINQTRMDVYNSRLAELGAAPVPTYRLPVSLALPPTPAGPRRDTTSSPVPGPARAADFGEMLDKEDVDTVIVTTKDRTHDEYIVAALEAGRDVITEKPMTVDVPRCRRILAAVDRTGRSVTVAFNYRYNPIHERVRELLAAGEIGEIGSVHFEWVLDTRHGADYFRRWHRDKADSGGLLVHKSTHHFDLVNWWIDSRPADVHAMGRLFFYGEENGRRHGYARGYERAHGSPEAAGDPFALRLADSPGLAALYLDAEHEDGYHRDQNVFAPGISIEDDMAVTVRYASGAIMTYHLTAYSPWEGYRVMFNGSRGRLELEVIENAYVTPPGGQRSAALHGAEPAKEGGSARILVRPLWEPAREIPLEVGQGGHGGADRRMTDVLFGGSPGPDPLGRGATHRDGALSLLTGFAANRSLETGLPVRVAEMLDIT